MEKIFIGEHIRALDQYTIRHEPIRSVDLVERAATAFVNEFLRHHSEREHIYIFAGPGNNGADALAIARLLLERGGKPEAILFNTGGKLSADCTENKSRLLATEGHRLSEVIDSFIPPEINPGDIVLDGLFGTGLNRPLRGGYAALVAFINKSRAKIIAIDLPSGLCTENNADNPDTGIIHATETYTFDFPKLSFLLPDAGLCVGHWRTLSIGLSDEGKRTIDSPYSLISDADMARAFLPRGRFAHKGTFGHALIAAGSFGKMGAACLAAKSALRSGAGRITMHVPTCGVEIAQISVPEAMVSADEECRSLSRIPNAEAFAVIGVGSGVGQFTETIGMFRNLLQQSHRPMVIDADALNILADHFDLQQMIPRDSILTPHPGEMDRLAGIKSESAYDRLQRARDLASRLGVYILLKGAYTATCMPSGNVVFNITGNPGMATAGSGDVLMGVVTGLLASGYAPATAAVMGAYLHGLAGDICAAKQSQESLLAGDIVAALGQAFRQFYV